MKAVVTTSHAVILVDSSLKRVQVVHLGAGLYYGIARYDDNIVVAARGRLAGEGLNSADERGCLLHFPTKTGPIFVEQPDADFRDLHEIDEIDGYIFCCCTFDNAVAVHGKGKTEFWYPFERPLLPPYDINHINSITHDNSYIYVLAHNWGEGSEIRTFSRKNLEFKSTLKIGYQAHTIWLDGEHIRICSSANGTIVGSDGLNAFLGGFLRGHASDGVHRMIGVSENVERPRRDQSNGSIILTDFYYRRQDEIKLDGFGMVLDILNVSDAEFEALQRFKHSTL